MTNPEEWIENELAQNGQQVYECVGSPPLAYSDGLENERYLAHVFDQCKDLGSDSIELESWIKDWPSEYHLSRKRGQLLKDFDFSSRNSVLEVGCGCGAITRHLGERLPTVISVEGSPGRAALARQRCRDLDTVAIISAPFQNLRFRQKFDLIICVGVFEYSATFVEDDDPYRAILRYFNEYLSEDGVLLLAIENQFGLKYWASASEDHTRDRYDGLEGYRRYPEKARTFGYADLKSMLAEYFSGIEYYLPLPDYKIPDAVISEQLLDRINAAPLMARFPSRDYLKPYRANFFEPLVWEGLSRNGQLAFFSNSFLVVASKGAKSSPVSMHGLANIYKRNRAERFHTHTRLSEETSGRGVIVEKSPLWAPAAPKDGFQTGPQVETENSIELQGYREAWVDGVTIQRMILTRAQDRRAGFSTVFEPAGDWVGLLREQGSKGPLPGGMLDGIWQNAIVSDAGVQLIDLEWHCRKEVTLDLLLVRAVYWFLVDLRQYPTIARSLRWRSSRGIISGVARQFGLSAGSQSLDDFLDIESELNATALGRDSRAVRRRLRLILITPQQLLIWMIKLQSRVRAAQFSLYRVWRVLRRLYHDRLRAV